MKQTTVHLLLILLIAGTVFFTNLGKARLWDRDEPRNAGCAAEMMERGNYVVPIFNDELRHQKPVLLYWLMMSAYSAFGVNEFSARFWSAVLAIGTTLFTYVIARRLFNSNVALLSALVLTTTLMFGVAGRAATPDSVLIFCSTLALMIYVLGTFAARDRESDPPRLRHAQSWFPGSWPVVIAMYAVMGLGVLAKGLAGAVLPTAIIGMFLLIKRLPNLDDAVHHRHSRIGQLLFNALRTFAPLHFLKTCWSMRPITAIAMILLVAAPWYLMVGIQTDGEFLQEFLIGEHFGRATNAMENHSGNVLYYPLTLLLGFFPWSIFAVPMVIGIDRLLAKRENHSSGVIFLLCWVLVQVGIFSIARTKLPSYITPCYPALAMLTGLFLFRLAADGAGVSRFWIYGAFAALITVGTAIIGGMVFVANEYLPGEYRLAVLGLIPVIGGIIGLALYWNEFHRSAVRTVFATSALFIVGFFGFGTVLVDSHQQSFRVFETANEVDPGAKLATYRCLESSWVVYAERPIVELLPVTQRIDRVSAERTRYWQDQPDLPVNQFLDQNPGGLIVTRTAVLEELRPFLPDEYAVLETTPFFLQDDELVLLGPRAVTASAPERTAHDRSAHDRSAKKYTFRR